MGSTVFQTIGQLLGQLVRNERGATTIEYSLIVALIAVVVVVSLGAIGEQLRDDVFGVVVRMLQSVLALG